MLVVFVPAPVRKTAKPAVRAKLPPLVTGRTTGTLVTRLNGSGETISTGRRPFCSWPDAGSRLTSQISPRFILVTPLFQRTFHQISSRPMGLLSSHSCCCFEPCFERIFERRALGSH